MYYFKEKSMPETEVNCLEYLSEAFKGLSPENKDCILRVARSLLKIQENNNYLVNSEAVSNSKKEDDLSLETLSAFADKKYKGVFQNENI
jgi:hypothetical protein